MSHVGWHFVLYYIGPSLCVAFLVQLPPPSCVFASICENESCSWLNAGSDELIYIYIYINIFFPPTQVEIVFWPPHYRELQLK